MSFKEISRKLSQFYATLDLKCELPEPITSTGLTPFLKKEFKSEENFWNYVENLQKLEGKYKTDEELIQKLTNLLKTEPLYFLVLTHLHRQMRFTNLELVHFLFDRERLDDAHYYLSLMKSDSVFKKLADKRSKSKSWIKYVGEVNLESQEDNVLASFKKIIASYLGPEDKCWKLWRSRIENDVAVPKRIAEFVVKNEDLMKLIESNSVKTAMERSLRTKSVEILKKERGEYGSNQVKYILNLAGFVFKEYEQFGDIEELEKEIKVQKTLDKSKYVYTVEKEWKKEGKKFDFVLISNNKVQFVMEVNYYTCLLYTSPSPRD